MELKTVRVTCKACGYKTVSVLIEDREDDLKCYRCKSDVEVDKVLGEVKSGIF